MSLGAENRNESQDLRDKEICSAMSRKIEKKIGLNSEANLDSVGLLQPPRVSKLKRRKQNNWQGEGRKEQTSP